MNTAAPKTTEQKLVEQKMAEQKAQLLARMAQGEKAAEGGKAGEEEDDDAEVCFICASPVVHNSVAPCNHHTCHICALRMRALYKTRDCAHCRVSPLLSNPKLDSIQDYDSIPRSNANNQQTPAPFVIFTDDATKRFEDFASPTTMLTDENIGVRYENAEIQMDTRILLRYNCPDPECDIACLSWPDLHKHVRGAHRMRICDLCSRHKKVFTHEHELYTEAALQTHMTKGDDNPGAIDQSGFKGHPSCGFCKLRFYGDDELYIHCRERHERCFVCERQTPGHPPVYYNNYDSLEVHFRKSHFLCPDQSCLDKKFIVFPSEMDLKAHQLDEHGDTLSKDVRRDARMVDISSFDYRAPYVQERRGGGSQREQRADRGRGRGRDPNAEPIPASTAQPLPRDQQAFQRQMAIHSAQSVSTRTFGGQLTQPTPTPRARAPAGAPNPPTVGVNPSARVEAVTSAVRSLDLAQDLAPADQARALRHRSVIERATILLQSSGPKLTQFRNLVSAFKASSITARNLIDSFFALFEETSSTALGTLIREVADLYEDKAKADNLRAAWNDWRAINEDYPSLPGPANPSTTFPGNWAIASSSSSNATSTNNSSSTPRSTRVLKLKNSTAQSSRSPVSQSRSWGSASSSTSFPGLPSSSSQPPQPTSQQQSSSRITTIPWSPNSSAPTSAPTSRPPSTVPSRGRNGASAGSDAFPALPPAKKPQTTIFGYGSGNLVRRDVGRGTSSFSWGAEGSGAGASANASGEEVEEESGKGKKRGNKGKKQVLMNWG